MSQNPINPEALKKKIQFILDNLHDAKEENQKLQQFIAIQEELIQNQREILIKISKKSQELLKIETERHQSLKKLTEYQQFLDKISKRSEEFQDEIKPVQSDNGRKLLTEEPEKFKKIYYGQKAIEAIQGVIFSITENCMKNDRNYITKAEMQSIIITVNKIIDMTIEAGNAFETPGQTIERRSKVINALSDK
jgi:predicted nuclease with TOPRIM domain